MKKWHKYLILGVTALTIMSVIDILLLVAGLDFIGLGPLGLFIVMFILCAWLPFVTVPKLPDIVLYPLAIILIGTMAWLHYCCTYVVGPSHHILPGENFP